jgi:succinate dehydrogenase flavin-adding protein (antitoxin of CptAB toxin-antitoxin module)
MPDNDVLDMVMGRTPCPDPGIESVIRRLQAA